MVLYHPAFTLQILANAKI